jgi:hypothetical protein
VLCWYFSWNKSAMFSDNTQYERALWNIRNSFLQSAKLAGVS